ncbi:MAG TPA: pyruvate dehydrogenase (acetyl-transferring), homodimeric type [Candidatus Limnocylindrales bacterium]|nr:pyruvate dehydrogenase (acetyl-transferring), homodimeric type [Candidatus Limnocylindrales bacterium]
MTTVDDFKHQLPDIDEHETQDWLDSLDQVLDQEGENRARFLMYKLLKRARQRHVGLPSLTQTRYINTISPEQEPYFPGDEVLERRIRRLIRWNAVAMVLRANNRFSGIGGHLATYASAASLYEVGFNHFFRGKDHPGGGDQIYFQGHAAPGIYSRAFLEGRLTEEHLDHFRRETGGKGLSSYPHPRLMPDFWEFPTVSMGLGPLAAVYQARFNRYLHNRGIKDTSQQRVWAFLGDGEMDEPESIAGISLAARDGLDNLTFVINCNLQRLDGPVRGNGKIIQELEGLFRGAGWNVIKVVWGREWDELLARDVDGVLLEKMNTTVDGEFQKMSVSTTGAYVREHFFGPDPRLRRMVEHLSDDQLLKLRRGGHDYRKIYAAYLAATEFTGAPTVILAKTVKGWTLGRGVEARNITHQAKKLSEDELRVFRDRLELPIPDEQLKDAPYFHPGPDSEEVQYMLQRRQALGGPLPRRVVRSQPLPVIGDAVDKEFDAGSPTAVSTTMVFTRLLRNLIRDPQVGKRIVPIIPDEARTFGMDPLFKEVGIYASGGQHYDPVDSDLVLSYREAKDGQVLEEGITEAGSMASLQAAGTSYATHGEPVIPFYIFYSMFGFQRTGDQVWAFGDQRGRGFMIGATAGRTTLAGEGLQHDDGHSQVLASTVPVVRAYDPAYAYELAAIVREGITRMYTDGEDVFYYVTVYNENYPQAPKPEGADEGIVKGIYRFAAAPDIKDSKGRVRLVGSGSILQQVIAARDLLAERGIAAEIYSATSFQQLRHEALQAERWNQLNPDKPARVPYVEQVLGQDGGPIVVATDWIKTLPDMIARWMKAPYLVLGTDGYGRSDTRENLRAWFGIDAPHIAAAAYTGLVQCGELEPKAAAKAIKELGVDPASPDPLTA